MQEQEFTTNKYGENFRIDSPTVIIASANPIGGSWKDTSDDKIDQDKSDKTHYKIGLTLYLHSKIAEMKRNLENMLRKNPRLKNAKHDIHHF